MLGITTSGVNIENIQLAPELEKNNITNIDCAITNLVVNSPNIIFTTVFNGFDPTEQDIILGNCSM